MKYYRAILPYFLITLVAAILVNNMFYGFSWTDEGLYLSNVHRFFTGDRFLIDDWTPTQFYEPLLLPLYVLFIKFNGGTEGVFLFFRIATIIFQTCVSVFSYSVFSKKYHILPSLAAALLPLIFSRACLNGASYYTIGFETYLLGILCAFSFFELSYKKFFLVLSGIFFAFSVLCNPFLAFPYVVMSLFSITLNSTRKYVKYFFLVWLGTFIVAIIYCITVFSGNSIKDILLGLHYTYNDPAYKHTAILTIKRLYKMPRLLCFPYIITYLPMIVLSILYRLEKIQSTKRNMFILFAMNTILFFANCFYEFDVGSAIICFFHYTFFSVIIFLPICSAKETLIKFITENKTELIYFILPGLILAYFFCFASDTGFGVCAIGMCIAAIGEIFIYNKYVASMVKKYVINERGGGIDFIKILPLLILCLTTLYYRVNNIYRDKKLSPHLLFLPNRGIGIEKIEQGPAKHIYTSAENKIYYDELYELLSDLQGEEKTIFISGVATWAYMSFQNLGCAAPTTWRTFFDDERLKIYFDEFPKKIFPDYVLILDKRNPSNDEDVSDFYSSYLYSELKKRGYEKQEVKSGILYSKKTDFDIQ